jgi:hypothetical protein
MKYSEKNKPIECIMTNSTCYKGTSKNFVPKGVLWHDTGADNVLISRYVQPYETDANYDEMMKLLGKNRYSNDWNHKHREAGVHAFIGKLADGTVTSVQTLPLNYKPWGCGAGSKGSLNGACLQFEICRDSMNSKEYFEAVYTEACELTAYYCKLYNLDPLGTFVYNGVTVPVITSHAESYSLKLGSNHGDPLKWLKKFGKTMDDVRNDVAKLMEAAQAPVAQKEKKEMYRVRKSWKDSKSQVGAFYGLENAINACKQAGAGYCVFDKAGECVYPSADIIVMDGVPSTGSEADIKKIWDYFLDKLGNEFGVAGLMGNLSAESSFRSNNLQSSYEQKLGHTDITYTFAVDNGTYDNFVKDSAGYGLAQWTHYTRKQKLLDYAKSKNKSVGDFKMQLDFLWRELQGYKAVLATLKSATTVLEASRSVHVGYEKPADQTEANITRRANIGQKYYDKYAKKIVKKEENKEEIKVPIYTPISFVVGDRVKLVGGATYANGKSIPAWVFKTTLYVRAINGDNIKVSILKVGAITGIVKAKDLISLEPVLSLGDKVKLVKGAKYTSGKSIPSWVFEKVLYVRAINGQKITISTLKTGDITGVVFKKDLVKYE